MILVQTITIGLNLNQASTKKKTQGKGRKFINKLKKGWVKMLVYEPETNELIKILVDEYKAILIHSNGETFIREVSKFTCVFMEFIENGRIVQIENTNKDDTPENWGSELRG
jgi:hypothetical protein